MDQPSKESSPWLTFIESNTTGTGPLFLRAAERLGLRPLLLASDLSRYSFVALHGFAALSVNTLDEEALALACHEFARHPRLAGITSSSEYFVASAARLAHKFGLPGPSPDAVQDCRDKLRQRQCLREAGAGIPAFAPARTAPEATSAARIIGLPVVVKPTSGSGSSGVMLCEDLDEVAQHADSLLQRVRDERGQPVPHRILVEEYTEGPEYSVETFGLHVIGITQKHVGPLPNFVEVGHDFPAALPLEAAAQVSKAAIHAVTALGLTWGPAHIELRLTASGPVIMEVNPRLAGGLIPELVRLAHGVDLVSATVQIVAGQQPYLTRQHSRYASIRFLLPPQDGRLLGVVGLDVAAQMPGVADVAMYARNGDTLTRRRDFRDRIGHVITTADSLAEAQRLAEIARDSLQILVQPLHDHGQ